MANSICPHCGNPVILHPSAEARAAKYGLTADYYRRLFPSHSGCLVTARSAESVHLMRKLSAQA